MSFSLLYRFRNLYTHFSLPVYLLNVLPSHPPFLVLLSCISCLGRPGCLPSGRGACSPIVLRSWSCCCGWASVCLGSWFLCYCLFTVPACPPVLLVCCFLVLSPVPLPCYRGPFLHGLLVPVSWPALVLFLWPAPVLFLWPALVPFSLLFSVPGSGSCYWSAVVPVFLSCFSALLVQPCLSCFSGLFRLLLLFFSVRCAGQLENLLSLFSCSFLYPLFSEIICDRAGCSVVGGMCVVWVGCCVRIIII